MIGLLGLADDELLGRPFPLDGSELVDLGELRGNIGLGTDVAAGWRQIVAPVVNGAVVHHMGDGDDPAIITAEQIADLQAVHLGLRDAAGGVDGCLCWMRLMAEALIQSADEGDSYHRSTGDDDVSLRPGQIHHLSPFCQRQSWGW